jgi:hypothetical protein
MVDMYENHSDVLEEKYKRKPFLSDMTLWYMYALTTSLVSRNNSTMAPENFTRRLPCFANNHNYCDSAAVGFTSIGIE